MKNPKDMTQEVPVLLIDKACERENHLLRKQLADAKTVQVLTGAMGTVYSNASLDQGSEAKDCFEIRFSETHRQEMCPLCLLDDVELRIGGFIARATQFHRFFLSNSIPETDNHDNIFCAFGDPCKMILSGKIHHRVFRDAHEGSASFESDDMDNEASEIVAWPDFLKGFVLRYIQQEEEQIYFDFKLSDISPEAQAYIYISFTGAQLDAELVQGALCNL